jgi:hypothetical protein
VTGKGQPPYDPRLTLKVLVYAYATGIRSSRQMERLCRESLPYLFLTRGDAPSYRTLCFTRVKCKAEIEQVWVGLLAIGGTLGLSRMGRITLDSTKLRANAGPESVVRRAEFARVRAELSRILSEAQALDAQEDVEGAPSQTVLEACATPEQMRDILRRVRADEAQQRQEEQEGETVPDEQAPAPPAPLGPRMRERIAAAVAAIDAAEEDDRKHVCLTDPDARMLGEGRSKQLRECHSFEVAIDNGLVVASGVTGEQDNGRLVPLVESAKGNEPAGVVSVDADSGYWRGDDIAALEKAGVETCVPDSFTACDMKKGLPVGTTRVKGRGSVPFIYDAESDCYRCPEGNTLAFKQQRVVSALTVRDYGAVRECTGCSRLSLCLTAKGARRRRLRVGVESARITAILSRFADSAWRARYHLRAPRVETVFGFLRGALGYGSWLLRGSERVQAEAALFSAAYQFRKVQNLRT